MVCLWLCVYVDEKVKRIKNQKWKANEGNSYIYVCNNDRPSYISHYILFICECFCNQNPIYCYVKWK